MGCSSPWSCCRPTRAAPSRWRPSASASSGPERMLDCLTALAHRLWVLVEPPLHGFEHVLMLPPGDAALLSRRATILDRATAARVGRIAAQLLPMFLGSEGIFEFLARRAAIDILLRQIDEVLL